MNEPPSPTFHLNLANVHIFLVNLTKLGKYPPKDQIAHSCRWCEGLLQEGWMQGVRVRLQTHCGGQQWLAVKEEESYSLPVS